MGHANSTLPSCICMVKRLKKLTQSTRDKSQWIAAQRLLSAHTIPGIIWIVCPGIRDHHKSTMGTCHHISEALIFADIIYYYALYI